ncbi:MAG: EF-hand domain-containing protein [Steroidobacteraceae bacterium]
MKMPNAILFTALLSSAAFAQQEPQSAPATPNAVTQPPATPPAGPPVDVGAIFSKLDTNHDGKLTGQEAQAHPTVAAHFSNADTDGDGFVSKDEFMTAFKPQQ